MQFVGPLCGKSQSGFGKARGGANGERAVLGKAPQKSKERIRIRLLRALKRAEGACGKQGRNDFGKRASGKSMRRWESSSSRNRRFSLSQKRAYRLSRTKRKRSMAAASATPASSSAAYSLTVRGRKKRKAAQNSTSRNAA